MSTSSLDPIYLNKATAAFISMLESGRSPNGVRYALTRAPRRATIVSRQTIDVATMTATNFRKAMFLENDEVVAGSLVPSGTALTPEPRLVSGQASPSDVAFGIMAHQWGFDSQRFYGATPAATAVNSVFGVISQASALIEQGGATVEGPLSCQESLLGEPGSRVSLGTVAGELLSGIENPNNYAYEPQPIVIPPTSTLSPFIKFDGSQFASRSPAVDTNFVLFWKLETLVCNVRPLA